MIEKFSFHAEKNTESSELIRKKGKKSSCEMRAKSMSKKAHALFELGLGALSSSLDTAKIQKNTSAIPRLPKIQNTCAQIVCATRLDCLAHRGRARCWCNCTARVPVSIVVHWMTLAIFLSSVRWSRLNRVFPRELPQVS